MDDLRRNEEQQRIKDFLRGIGWFGEPGAYVLVDGQYGSTGKGAIAALLARHFGGDVHVVTTNAGPNSGHTGYYEELTTNKRPSPSAATFHSVYPGWGKVVTQQIPVFAVVARRHNFPRKPFAYLNAGAVVNPIILRGEAKAYGFDTLSLTVHPNAAVIDHEFEDDGPAAAKIATTNKGVGQAIARKVMREGNVAKGRRQDFSYVADIAAPAWDWQHDVVFVETPQGFSLGINQPFYPFTTSRECTVGQAIADAAIPHNQVRRVMLSVRTFPIRVGNTTEGQSGDCYPDQEETTWEKLGLKPEMTTVTKRVRRVFTWSDEQFAAAVTANQPDAICVNFMDYLDEAGRLGLLERIGSVYRDVMGHYPPLVLSGYGPLPTDMRVEYP